MSMDSDRVTTLQEINRHNLLEVGAAALLVGDTESIMKGKPWKHFGTTEMPYLGQLLQPSSLTTLINAASASSHLRAVTASKRSKAGPQVWYFFLAQITGFICLIHLFKLSSFREKYGLRE